MARGARPSILALCERGDSAALLGDEERTVPSETSTLSQGTPRPARADAGLARHATPPPPRSAPIIPLTPPQARPQA